MSPRLTDWSLALAAVLAFMTGIVSLVSGLPQEWFIETPFWIPAPFHGAGGKNARPRAKTVDFSDGMCYNVKHETETRLQVQSVSYS